MSKYSELFPDQYIDETGNTRIDGNIVSLNNALDVTSDVVTVKKPLHVNGTQFNEGNFYLKNTLVDDINNLPAGYVAIGFDRNIAYFASSDFEGAVKFIDARGFRIIAETGIDLELNDEFLVLGSSSSNQYSINMPENPYDNTKVHYVGAIGTEQPHAVLDAGNTDIVMHIKDSSTGTLTEVYRDKTLLLNSSDRQSLRYLIVSIDPLVTEWHGTVGVSE